MKHLDVAVAAIRDNQNRLLISKRLDHLHQGGLWEFPGGKIESGESIKQALIREINEEVGIEVLSARPLISIPHQYSDRSVCLHVWLVEKISGEPEGKEGQEIRWVDQSQLQNYAFPAANRSIVSALQLPNQYLITPQKETLPELFQYLNGPIERGVQCVQFRASDWTASQYKKAVPAMLDYCRSKEVQLILNSNPDLLKSMEADGIHLNRHHLAEHSSRPCSREKWLGASCHSWSEIEQAQRLEVDYISLSPVLRTNTHPNEVPLGWQQFTEWVERCSVPVYALGGMSELDVQAAIDAGAQGIAGISLYN